MKNNKKIFSLILIIICIIIGIVIFFNFNKTTKTTEWDIKIHEYWNNIFAGKRMHENRNLLINTEKCIGKITYYDENGEYKETHEFKIKMQDISKILDLANKGESTMKKENPESYTIYEIETTTKITYVDAKLDNENLISNLFID